MGYVSISSRSSVGVGKKKCPGLPDQSTSPVDQVWFGPFVPQLSYYAQIEENMAGHEEDMDDLIHEFKHLKTVRKRSRKCKLEEGSGIRMGFKRGGCFCASGDILIKDCGTNKVIGMRFHDGGNRDVIAFVRSIDPLEEYYSGAEKKTKLRLMLGGGRGNTVQIVLYDDCASKFATHDFSAIQKPTVLLAQLARIGFDEGEVAEFIASVEHLPSPTISLLTPTAGKRCTILPKLRLNYLVADESGIASIVFFDKHASKLLKKSVAQLKADIPKAEICFAFPKEVDNLIATDLIDAFDAVATEVGQPSVICHDDEEEIILVRNCTAEDKGPPTAEPNVTQFESLPTIDLNDISISDDLHVIPSKGKRKVSLKKHAAQALNIATYGPSSPAKTSSKPLKSIKQEKN
ncbi:hypothetical protein K1719_000138 [Acacia pycnantha]|nr:hypothetical protein K1719_000138 [Acacia pycnantha]